MPTSDGNYFKSINSTVSEVRLEEWPLNTLREISVGYATVSIIRRRIFGQNGFELLVPTEFAGGVYDVLTSTGANFGILDIGVYACKSLRVENGIPAWGCEMTPERTPYEIGFGISDDLNKKERFIGRDALRAGQDKPRKGRIVFFTATAPDAPLAWGGEMIATNGRPMGYVTSAAFGAMVGRVVALGWINIGGERVDQSWLDGQSFTIDVAGDAVPVRGYLDPFYGTAHAHRVTSVM